MKLPNGERADLGTKLEEYTLNPAHFEGRHKARVFESTVGVTLANADVLRRALLEAAATSDLAESQGDHGYGELFVLKFPCSTAKGTAIIVSAWIVRHGEDFPRLTTCYIG